MSTRKGSPRMALAVVLLVVATTAAFAQHSWGDVVKGSQRITLEDWGGVGSGNVAEGFASFAVDLDSTGPLTIEVSVTDVRQGSEYADDDSMVFLFDAEGRLLAQNDDSPFGGLTSLINGYEIQNPGRYYVVVTTHPNWPETDGSDYFTNVGDEGASNIGFELVVEWGIREGEEYAGGDYSENLPTEIWFEDFAGLAKPIRYTGGEMVETGSVAEGAELYLLTTSQSQSVSIMVGARFGDYGDTVLFVIDSSGFVIAEDDDARGDGGSLIYDVYLEASEQYYVAVTTFPNWPNTDNEGYVEGFPLGGQESVEYELTIGPPQEYVYEEGYYGGETVYWFDSFPDRATPLTYTGTDLTPAGTVTSDISVFRLTTRESTSVSIEVAPYSDYTDSVLYVFDEDGYMLAEDDDSGMNGGSLVYDLYLERGMGYYVVVAAYPSYPNMDEYGYLEGFPESGSDELDFDLIIGQPREYVDDYGYDNYGAEPYPDDGVGAGSFGEVVESAQWIPISGGRGIGAGEVGIGYSAFAMDITEPLYVTVEVMVTDIRQGVSYADSDSMLAIFGPGGRLLASDDDGGVDGASKIESLWIADPGTYYAIVTTYPNEPNTRGDVFSSIDTQGESNIAFDLVVRTDIAAQ